MPNQPLPTPTPPTQAPSASAPTPIVPAQSTPTPTVSQPPQPPVPQPMKPPTSFTPTAGTPKAGTPAAGATPASTPPPTLPTTPSTTLNASQPSAPKPATPPPPAGPPRPPAAAGSPIPTPPKPGAVPPATPPTSGAPSTPGAANGAPTNPVKPAMVKKSPMRFLPIILGALLVVGVVGFLATRFLGGGSRQPVTSQPTGPDGTTPQRTTVPGNTTTITYWGLWEPTDVLEQVFEQFEAANPGVNVEYTQQSVSDYRERLQTAIASGRGPDVFRYHATWVPMLRNELAPVPASVYSTTQFQDTFYPVAFDQLQSNGQLVGIPLEYDGLALFYNQEMLRAAGAEPPTTWAELRTLASQLTVRSGNSIQRGGAALGNASNVEHFADIIGLLMLQNGANLANPVSAEARDALQFYTNFALVDKIWDDTLPSSTTAFARGDVAMMFAPSWRALEVIALNPDLEFGIAPVPKLGENRTAWATYWAEGVSAQSGNKTTGWALLQYMSTPEIMQQLYSAQSGIRPFGEPYSRVDLANNLADQPMVAPFLSDAPNANGWYLSTFTFDNGINDQIIKYYRDAVNAVLTGTSVDNALQTVAQGTSQVLRQYGVSTSGTVAQ